MTLLCATLLVFVVNAADEFRWSSTRIYFSSHTCSGESQTLLNPLDQCFPDDTKLVDTGDGTLTKFAYSDGKCAGAHTAVVQTYVAGSCVLGTKTSCPDGKCSLLTTYLTPPLKQPPCEGMDYPLAAYYTGSSCFVGTPLQITTAPCAKGASGGSANMRCNNGKPQQCTYSSTDCSGNPTTCTDVPASEGAKCTVRGPMSMVVVCPTTANPNPLNLKCASNNPGTTTTTTTTLHPDTTTTTTTNPPNPASTGKRGGVTQSCTFVFAFAFLRTVL